jgi:hypothetical protein
MLVRWTASGTYHHGFPRRSPDAVGWGITFTGTDTLRIPGGQLLEYWPNADGLSFVQQLDVREVTGRT